MKKIFLFFLCLIVFSSSCFAFFGIGEQKSIFTTTIVSGLTTQQADSRYCQKDFSNCNITGANITQNYYNLDANYSQINASIRGICFDGTLANTSTLNLYIPINSTNNLRGLTLINHESKQGNITWGIQDANQRYSLGLFNYVFGFKIPTGGNITVNDNAICTANNNCNYLSNPGGLSGIGNAYACLDSSGNLFRSNEPCVPAMG